MIFIVLCMNSLIWGADNEWSGADYRRENKVQEKWARPLLERIKQHEYAVILDIGCGTGELTMELARYYPNSVITGLDPDSSMLAEAKQQCKDASLKNVQWVNGKVPDFLESAKHHNKYSAIVSFSALHWLSSDDLKKTIALSHKALQSDGRLYVLMAGTRLNGTPNFLTKSVNTVIGECKDIFKKAGIEGLENNVQMPKCMDVATMCGSTGFTIESIELKEVDHIFKSVGAFEQWLHVVSPYKKIVGDLHNELVNRIVKEYQKHLPAQADGSIVYRDYMIYGIVKK